MNLMIRTGIDLVNVPRFRTQLAASRSDFRRRFLTDAERVQIGNNVERAAARWAAKEAVMKALGQGFGLQDPLDIEIQQENGAPVVALKGGAANRARELGLTTWSISITHEREWASAMVVAAGEKV